MLFISQVFCCLILLKHDWNSWVMDESIIYVPAVTTFDLMHFQVRHRITSPLGCRQHHGRSLDSCWWDMIVINLFVSCFFLCETDRLEVCLFIQQLRVCWMIWMPICWVNLAWTQQHWKSSKAVCSSANLAHCNCQACFHVSTGLVPYFAF